MKTNETLSILFAGLLFIGSASAAVAQTGAQDHDAHHPAGAQAAPAAPTGDAPTPSGMQGGMPGVGMMTPEMMQMMPRMMGQGGMPGMMGGMQGQRMPEGGMGQGMTGQMPMAGGMMMCPMMQMMGARSGMDMQSMMGAAMLYGMPHGNAEEMTPERVRTFLEQRLEIVTVDGSLVQKLAFNRYPGLFRQITE